MAVTSPFVTDKFTAYVGDVITTRLSLAVWLMDEFTGRQPVGSISLKIKGGDIKAVKNLSGYYLFNGLAAGTHTVRIESDFYFPEEEAVSTPLSNPKKPVVEIALKPAPNYPFPDNATLVRAVVSNAAPVADAEIEVTGKTIKTITDEKGEFVLYFKGIKTEAISIEIKKDGNTKVVNTIIEEGKTVSLGVVSFP